MQMEIISDLRERKLQVRTEERQGGYGTELLNNTAVEGIVGPAELSVDGEVQYTFSFGEKETLTEYLKKEKQELHVHYCILLRIILLIAILMSCMALNYKKSSAI